MATVPEYLANMIPNTTDTGTCIRTISVIIPTYNRSDLLATCLRSLENQTLGNDRFEVLVINDGSSDDTIKILEAFSRSTSLHFRYLSQENRGPGAARNRGATHATAEWVAFTDDDCIAEPEWLEELVNVIPADEQCAGGGGRTVRHRDGVVPEFIDHIGALNPQNLGHDIWFVITCNAFFRRAYLLEVGGFDERLTWAGGEEPLLCQQLEERGFYFVESNSAVVRHRHPETIRGLYRMFRRYGRGHAFQYQSGQFLVHHAIPIFLYRNVKDLIEILWLHEKSLVQRIRMIPLRLAANLGQFFGFSRAPDLGLTRPKMGLSDQWSISVFFLRRMIRDVIESVVKIPMRYVKRLLQKISAQKYGLPDFIIIGAHKCGTTALHVNLNLHPDISVVNGAFKGGEMFFFNRDELYLKEGIDYYRSFFRRSKLIQGEETPDYISSLECHERMLETVPGAKLILTLRNPVDRAYSHWNHFNMMGKKTKEWGWIDASFEECAKQDLTGLITRGKYIEQIEHLTEHFSPEQLHIIIAEHARRSPADEYRKVFAFLGVEEIADLPFLRTVHARPYPEPMNRETRQELLGYFESYNERLFEYLGYRVGSWTR